MQLISFESFQQQSLQFDLHLSHKLTNLQVQLLQNSYDRPLRFFLYFVQQKEVIAYRLNKIRLR